MPQLQDWIIWRRDRNKPLSEAEIDRLAVIAIDGEEDPARAMPWRKQAERS
ncbi:MAG: hypothetical protein J2P19_14055 [Pseudonocardia sp.]|nr:hypothetical protein [Pseudonocardia sp.]